MEDPRLEAAWQSYQRFMDGTPPHELPQQLRNMFVPDDVIDRLVARHEAETARIVALREPLGIGRENALNWYAGPRKDDKNWPAYEAKLRKQLPKDAVDKVHEASDKVVAMLDHPATARFDSRGLVVGHVQSGKTSNFTAVISKAADRGYRMFIILSGVHNSLRRQTQSRLLRDLVELNPPLWHQITDPDQDFQPRANAPSLFASRDQFLLLVVKKNTAVLRKLKAWLATAREQLENCPTLVIDDEADQATVATKKINPLIRGVLDQLPKVCYVGYTATPFGNLLIDPSNPKDFYPKDFVLSLPMGTGYQGPEVLFGREPLDGEEAEDVPAGSDMIREIPDDELDSLRPAKRAVIPGFNPQITPSLLSAVQWFWLATAARHARGQSGEHSSMLIHAHSDTSVHDSYAEPLRTLQASTRRRLEDSDPSLLQELRGLWETETSLVPAEEFDVPRTPWSDVLIYLNDVVSTTKVVLDHYRSTDRLDYDSGPVNVIAVGGNTLSRGLTLEGLVVSVFVRSADMYDTLLQMGRWFGYRPGYADLPRIWMPAAMRRWFSHLASVEADMRREIERYLTEHRTPLDMAVRIRCHPKMRVTAPSRMNSAVRAAAAYGGQLIETRYFPCAPDDSEAGVWDVAAWHEANEGAALSLLATAHREGVRAETGRSAAVLYRRVPSSAVLEFVDKYSFDQRSIEYSSTLVRAYIEKRMAKGGLKTWNVGVLGKELPSKPRVELPDGLMMGAVTRTRTKASENDPVADIKTLTGSRDPGLDLDLSRATGATPSRQELTALRAKQEPDVGLLLLYPIDAHSRASTTKKDRRDLHGPDNVQVIWGCAFIFPNPSSGADVQVEYDYVQADLRKVFPAAAEGADDEDGGILDQDQDKVLDDVPAATP